MDSENESEIKRLQNQLHALNEVARTLTLPLELEELLVRVLHKIIRVFTPAEVGLVMLGINLRVCSVPGPLMVMMPQSLDNWVFRRAKESPVKLLKAAKLCFWKNQMMLWRQWRISAPKFIYFDKCSGTQSNADLLAGAAGFCTRT